MFELAAVLLALAVLMVLAYRGISLLLLGPACALLAAALTGSLPILAAFTQVYMSNVGQFIVAFFPLFLLGAVFGKLMDDTGSARAIARSVSGWLGPQRAIASVVLCCALLTYGGVSAFVVAFAVVPIADALFREANIPRRLIPGAIGLGAFTFTMAALPGTPAIQNAIPMPHFGTTPFAAPGLGILTGLVMFGLGLVWLQHRAAAARAAGDGYRAPGGSAAVVPSLAEPDVVLREHALSGGFDLAELSRPPVPEKPSLPPFVLALLPVVVVIVANFLFIQFVVPRWDTSFLAEPLFGKTTIESVRGVWAVIVGLSLAILVLIGGNFRRLTDLRATLDHGADAAVLPIFNTASLVGFGAVIAALPVFTRISTAVMALGGGNPLISVAASVALLSGITGSASGGMSIALDALGPALLDMAKSAGVAPDVMHRVASVASGSLDVLPHSGAVITLLVVCGLTHRESYFDLFMTSIVAPMLSLIVLIVLASLFGSF